MSSYMHVSGQGSRTSSPDSPSLVTIRSRENVSTEVYPMEARSTDTERPESSTSYMLRKWLDETSDDRQVPLPHEDVRQPTALERDQKGYTEQKSDNDCKVDSDSELENDHNQGVREGYSGNSSREQTQGLHVAQTEAEKGLSICNDLLRQFKREKTLALEELKSDKEKIQVLEKQLSSSNDVLKRLEGQIRKRKDLLEKRLYRIKGLKRDKKNMENEMETVRSLLDSSGARRNALENKTRTLQQTLVQSEAEIRELEKQFAEKSKRYEDVTTSLTKLRQHTERSTNILKREKTSLANDNETLTRETRNLTNELADFKRRKEVEVNHLNNRIRTLVDENKTLEDQLKTKEEVYSNSQARNDEEVEKLSRLIDEKVVTNKQLEHELEHEKGQIWSLEHTIDKMQRQLLVKEKDHKKELESVIAIRDLNEKELRSELEGNIRETERLQADISSVQMQFKRAKHDALQTRSSNLLKMIGLPARPTLETLKQLYKRLHDDHWWTICSQASAHFNCTKENSMKYPFKVFQTIYEFCIELSEQQSTGLMEVLTMSPVENLESNKKGAILALINNLQADVASVGIGAVRVKFLKHVRQAVNNSSRFILRKDIKPFVKESVGTCWLMTFHKPQIDFDLTTGDEWPMLTVCDGESLQRVNEFQSGGTHTPFPTCLPGNAETTTSPEQPLSNNTERTLNTDNTLRHVRNARQQENQIGLGLRRRTQRYSNRGRNSASLGEDRNWTRQPLPAIGHSEQQTDEQGPLKSQRSGDID